MKETSGFFIPVTDQTASGCPLHLYTTRIKRGYCDVSIVMFAPSPPKRNINNYSNSADYFVKKKMWVIKKLIKIEKLQTHHIFIRWFQGITELKTTKTCEIVEYCSGQLTQFVIRIFLKLRGGGGDSHTRSELVSVRNLKKFLVVRQILPIKLKLIALNHILTQSSVYSLCHYSQGWEKKKKSTFWTTMIKK